MFFQGCLCAPITKLLRHHGLLFLLHHCSVLHIHVNNIAILGHQSHRSLTFGCRKVLVPRSVRSAAEVQRLNRHSAGFYHTPHPSQSIPSWGMVPLLTQFYRCHPKYRNRSPHTQLLMPPLAFHGPRGQSDGGIYTVPDPSARATVRGKRIAITAHHLHFLCMCSWNLLCL